MKLQFVIFFSIFFVIYFGVNAYIFLRGWQALEYFGRYRFVYAVLFAVASSSFILGRWLENYFKDGLNSFLVWAGSFWLAFIVYLFFALIATDIIRSLFTIFGKDPHLWTENYLLLKFWAALGIFLVSTVVIAGGFWNAMNPKVTTLEIFIDKDGGQKKEWNIVMASDIHTGTIINRTRFNQLVSEINAFNPDLVLLAGDTVDEDIKPVIQNDIGEALANIHSRYGIYGVTGNHEYIGGIEEAEKYLTEHGVILLRDQHVLVDDSFELVGREDHSIEQFDGVGTKRKTLDGVLTGVDLKRPVIMMDHQPFNLADLATDSRVDFQLSGHTHNGQLWPFNFITAAIYEVSQGYKRIGNTQFYVSSGWGTWGPPIRTSASPELVNLKLKFK